MSKQFSNDEYIQAAAALMVAGKAPEDLTLDKLQEQCARMFPGSGTEADDGEIKSAYEKAVEKAKADRAFDLKQLETKKQGNREEFLKGDPFTPPPNKVKPFTHYPEG
jgi:hypothetical protein